MIIVRNYGAGYVWHATVGSFGRPTLSHTYSSPDHALRDAWTWWPELPALIYTRRP